MRSRATSGTDTLSCRPTAQLSRRPAVLPPIRPTVSAAVVAAPHPTGSLSAQQKQPGATLSPGLRRPHRAPPGSATGPIAAGKRRSSLRLPSPRGPADTTISPHCATTCAIYCGLHHTRARFLHECITPTLASSPFKWGPPSGDQHPPVQTHTFLFPALKQLLSPDPPLFLGPVHPANLPRSSPRCLCMHRFSHHTIRTYTSSVCTFGSPRQRRHYYVILFVYYLYFYTYLSSQFPSLL